MSLTGGAGSRRKRRTAYSSGRREKVGYISPRQDLGIKKRRVRNPTQSALHGTGLRGRFRWLRA